MSLKLYSAKYFLRTKDDCWSLAGFHNYVQANITPVPPLNQINTHFFNQLKCIKDKAELPWCAIAGELLEKKSRRVCAVDHFLYLAQAMMLLTFFFRLLAMVSKNGIIFRRWQGWHLQPCCHHRNLGSCCHRRNSPKHSPFIETCIIYIKNVFDKCARLEEGKRNVAREEV